MQVATPTNTNSTSAQDVGSQTKFISSKLPVSQLESLRFKANQIIESIQTLQRTIEVGGQPVMPPWPDILSKYNVLLSQTHNFSNALTSTMATSAVALSAGGISANRKPPGNLFEKIALHPTTGMTDAQLDMEVIPLLRNQQTTDVLRMENETVRRLAELMTTRGSLGVLGMVQMPTPGAHFGIVPKKPEYEDVLAECDQIRIEHDSRVDRAVKAVTLLRDKYDWKQRVEVEVEEPEELQWDPRMRSASPVVVGERTRMRVDEDEDMESDDDDEDDDESDEDEVEGELQLVGEGHTPLPNGGLAPDGMNGIIQ